MSFLDTQSIKRPKTKGRLHWSIRESAQRSLEAVVPSLQITLAATAAYFVAHLGLGHAIPFLAVTVTITSLGLTRDARPKRILQTALGMVSGIAISELMLLTFGQGIWQLPTLMIFVLLAARFVTNSATFALAATTQSVLVYLTVAPAGGPFVRSIDGLVGAAVSLLATALIPRDPRGMAKKDAQKLFEVFLETLGATRVVLRSTDVASADATLLTVRRTQPLLDNWRMSLDSAISISRVSPFLRRHRGELLGQTRLLRGMDLATRNLRVVVRRIDFLIRDGQPRPYLAELLGQIEEATKVLFQGIDDRERQEDAIELFTEIIHQLDPKRFGIADQLREASVLLLLRPLLVDLLCASGLSEDEARAELPEI
jgi:uncharacterized membrane protein YgaE (UPF0421/DUF939 family)